MSILTWVDGVFEHLVRFVEYDSVPVDLLQANVVLVIRVGLQKEHEYKGSKQARSKKQERSKRREEEIFYHALFYLFEFFFQFFDARNLIVNVFTRRVIVTIQ